MSLSIITPPLAYKLPDPSTARTLYPVSTGQSAWIYHSENWTRVITRFADRKLLQEGRSLSLIDNEEHMPSCIKRDELGNFDITIATGDHELWFYCYLPPEQYIWRNFVWRLSISRNSDFRELQLGFRYRDFYNRYRFRHEQDTFYFDKVANGKFINEIARAPFVMEPNRSYRVEILVIGYRYALFIDGVRVLECLDVDKSFSQGSIAIILWEDDHKTGIKAMIGNQQVVEIDAA